MFLGVVQYFRSANQMLVPVDDERESVRIFDCAFLSVLILDKIMAIFLFGYLIGNLSQTRLDATQNDITANQDGMIISLSFSFLNSEPSLNVKNIERVASIILFNNNYNDINK